MSIKKDPRCCPKCGAMGKKPYRSKNIKFGVLKQTWYCPKCGERWLTQMTKIFE